LHLVGFFFFKLYYDARIYDTSSVVCTMLPSSCMTEVPIQKQYSDYAV